MSKQEPIDIIRKAVDNGMKLSHISNIRKFKNEMFDFLTNKHFCYEDSGRYIVGNIYDDIAVIEIENSTLRIAPIMQFGFFEILMNLFKFYSEYKEKEVMKNINEIKKEIEVDDDGEFWV